jgi:hypothetical protein
LKSESSLTAQCGPDAPAIAHFSNLLENRGCIYWLENELSQVLPTRNTRPDFFVKTPNDIQLLVEVESFEKERFALIALRQQPALSGLSDSDHRRICNPVQRASKQLKPYRDLRIPTLVVLDDFRDVGMPTNSDIIGLSLLRYFDPRKDRSHVSAVAWLMGDCESAFYLRIFHNPHSRTPLPKEAFHAQADEHWYQSSGEFWKKDTNGHGTH